jgi:ADP-ribose pyrophosphatase YjhB (NUDIX family)
MLGSPTPERITVVQPEHEIRTALPPALESMTLLAASVIVHDRAADRVLLLRRGPQAKFAQGMWDLPTGKSDPGEPVTETAVRELREETGLVVKAEHLRLAHVVHGARAVESPNGYLTVVFAAHEWSGEPENREPEKHSQVRWAPTDAIPENFVPSTAGALRGYLTGGPQLSLVRWNS